MDIIFKIYVFMMFFLFATCLCEYQQIEYERNRSNNINNERITLFKENKELKFEMERIKLAYDKRL